MKIGFLRYIILTVFLFSFSFSEAQILKFDHGTIEFYTGTVVSDIEAVSEKAEVSLNTKTGEVTVEINIESFEFNYELMQEHFNEKYMESEKFPKATFKGKIIQDISNGIEDPMEADVTGKLTIHGVSKEIEFKANLAKQGNLNVVKSKIPVLFKDYGIDDPSILSKSVAKEVSIEIELYLVQLET